MPGMSIGTNSKEEYPKVYLYSRIVRAKLFIDANYNTKIDLENICDEACFSKFHFIRLFKKIYEKTPHQYLSDVRIHKAKELLRNGFSVNDSCFLVGFESVTSFTALFRKSVGKNPSAYQEEQKIMQKKIATKPLQYIPGCFAEMKGWSKKSNFEEA
jgi:AraC-like DNA-binding protein